MDDDLLANESLRVKKSSKLDLTTHENEPENLNLKNIATEVVLPCQNDPLIKFSKVVNESKNKVLRLFGSDKTCLMEIK